MGKSSVSIPTASNFKNNNIFKWKAHAKAETTYRLYEDYLYVIEDIVEMRAELGVIVI